MEPRVFWRAGIRAAGSLAGIALLFIAGAPRSVHAQGPSEEQAITLYRQAADRYEAVRCLPAKSGSRR